MGSYESNFVRLGSALAVVVPFILSASFATGVVLQTSAGQTYYCLSNLGVSGVPYVPYFFNVPLILSGIAVIIFAVALARVVRGGRLFLAGAVLLIVSGVFVSLVGVFTQANLGLHDFVSNTQFAIFPISVILIGVSFLRNGLRREGFVSVVIPIVMVPLALFANYGPLFTAHRCAASEWTAALGLSAWLIWMGLNLPRLATRGAKSVPQDVSAVS